MTAVIFLFVMLLAAALQAAVPTLIWTGCAPIPFLLGVVIYFALVNKPVRIVQIALLLGVLDDSLGMKPLGFSAFCFAAVALLIFRFRDLMTVRAWTTHAFLGAIANFSTTVVTWVLLAKDGQLHWQWNWLLLKFCGSLVTGAILTPLMFAALSSLDRLTGRPRVEEEQIGRAHV